MAPLAHARVTVVFFILQIRLVCSVKVWNPGEKVFGIQYSVFGIRCGQGEEVFGVVGITDITTETNLMKPYRYSICFCCFTTNTYRISINIYCFSHNSPSYCLLFNSYYRLPNTEYILTSSYWLPNTEYRLPSYSVVGITDITTETNFMKPYRYSIYFCCFATINYRISINIYCFF